VREAPTRRSRAPAMRFMWGSSRLRRGRARCEEAPLRLPVPSAHSPCRPHRSRTQPNRQRARGSPAVGTMPPRNSRSACSVIRSACSVVRCPPRFRPPRWSSRNRSQTASMCPWGRVAQDLRSFGSYTTRTIYGGRRNREASDSRCLDPHARWPQVRDFIMAATVDRLVE